VTNTYGTCVSADECTTLSTGQPGVPVMCLTPTRFRKYVLLDFEGVPVRYFDWHYPGSVPIPEPIVDISTLEECLF
jgi:hypothetical protein